MNSYEAGNSFREIGDRMRDGQWPGRDRYRIALSLCIAFATLLGALVSWSASVALSQAGKSDRDGITATRNAEESRSTATTDTYLHLVQYVDYRRHAIAVGILADEQASPLYSETEGQVLSQRLIESSAVAESLLRYIAPRAYFNQDEPDVYDLEREIGERTVANQEDFDVEPAPHVLRADQLRTKATSLVLILVVTAGALVLFTFAYESRGRARYFWCVPALTLFVIALGDFVRLELL